MTTNREIDRRRPKFHLNTFWKVKESCRAFHRNRAGEALRIHEDPAVFPTLLVERGIVEMTRTPGFPTRGREGPDAPQFRVSNDSSAEEIFFLESLAGIR